MITRKQAVKMSVKKWEAYASGKLAYRGECGFCEYILDPFLVLKPSSMKEKSGEMCYPCPLFPDICSDKPHREHLPLYWQWCATNSQETAQQILDAIRTRGQAWIESE